MRCWCHACKTKDDQISGFSCNVLTLQVEWQEGHLAPKNPVVVPVSLTCVRTPVHPGVPGKRAVKWHVVVVVVT